MSKRILFAAIVAALFSILLAGCNKKPQPPLVFGAGIWPGYEPVYLARELGYYVKDNLRLADYTGESEVVQAFRSGSVQAAALTLEQALLLRRDIPDVKIILLFDSSGSRMDVLVTHDQDIGQYHRELQQLLQGWRRALEYMHDNPDKAAQVMAQREHVAPAKFSSALKGLELYGWQRNQQLMLGEPPPVGGSINAVQRSMLNRGRINIGIDPSMLLDPTLLAGPDK
jgi:ABC-type nitrate/sulfonate/bicarbonate transport system substrate-binding protein